MLARLRETGIMPKPVEIDAMILEAIRQTEVLDNLDAINATGAQAIYLYCDIRDEDSVRTAIAEGENAMGKITGLIHGAGAIADKNIERKMQRDFHTVYDTKVTGLEHCLKYLDAPSLQYLVMFSSIAAYFGNPRQVDYSMANEILNRFCFEFKKAYPDCQVMSINWGPWVGGMVTSLLAKLLVAKKVTLIPYELGAEYFADQFRFDFGLGDVQLVVSGIDRQLSNDVDFDLNELR
jgi:NAD(P)-dependent dehydrogenase (short-subunit alcohol dehydrogenase family)